MSISCPFEVTVTFSRLMETFVVSKANFTHNHKVSKEIFASIYPKNRMPAELKSYDLATLTNLGAKPKKIKYFLEDKFETNLTSKDVHNLMYRSKCVVNDDFENLKKLSEDFCAEGNVMHVIKSEQNVLKSIYVQLFESIQLFASFPHVLLIDVTYKLNALNFPLLIFMISDNMGCGRIVAGSYIDCETQESFEDAIKIFKNENKNWHSINTVMLDKDMSEINAVKNQFPNAKIRLCMFHVQTAFLRKIKSLSISKIESDKSIEFFRMLCFANSLEEFNEIETRFLKNCSKNVETYYCKNWQNIKDQWAGFALKDTIIYGNTTNNRLESKNGKLKLLIKPTDGLIESVKAFITFVKKDISEMTIKKTREQFTVTTESNGSLLIRLCESVLTSFATKIVKKSEILANSSKFVFSKNADGNINVRFSSKNSKPTTATINLNESTCDCRQFNIYRLPCCHLISYYYSKNLNFNVKTFPKQYFLDFEFQNTVIEKKQNVQKRLSIQKKEKVQKKLSDRNKFSLIKPKIDRFIAIMTNLSSEKFLNGLEVASKFFDDFE